MTTPKALAWSDGRLNTFNQCLFKAYNEYCLPKHERPPFIQTEAMKKGNEDHKSLELAIRFGSVLPPHLQALPEVVRWVDYYRDHVARGNRVVAEYEMCISDKLVPVSWFSKEAWGRAKADVFVHKHAHNANPERGQLEFMDWKSGKPSDNWSNQAARYMVVAFFTYPGAQRITMDVLYYNHNVIQSMTVDRAQITALFDPILKTLEKVRNAQISGDWPTSPSGLCPWCPVTTCAHWRPKPQGR